jgi:hypothetical protein
MLFLSLFEGVVDVDVMVTLGAERAPTGECESMTADRAPWEEPNMSD